MIKQLQIKNYAIIEQLTINFAEGLTIITGETGAGKSIILGALGLVMGQRADSKSLFDLDKKCVIEAVFDVEKYKDMKTFFEEEDLDYSQEVIVRREITPSGKSRAFINDTPVNLKVVQRLTQALIDLHQQFDSLDMNRESFQLKMVDALAKNTILLTNYRNQYFKYALDKKTLATLIEKKARSEKEMDFLQFQLNELADAELEADEQEVLEQDLKQLTNAEEIKKTLSGVYRQLVEEEQSSIDQLENIGIVLHQIQDFHPEVKATYERFEEVILELKEAAHTFEKIAEDTEYDEERIIEVQGRLDTLYRLQKKHGVVNNQELLAIQTELQEKLNLFSDTTEEIQRLEKRIHEQEKQLYQYALQLREKRQAVIPNFQKKVGAMLKQLSMQHAQLEIKLNEVEELGSTGLDEVNFLFAANKGSRLQAIKDVASGGEISRLALVTKSLVASAIPLPTLMFDEIDAGVSGSVAKRMGEILRELSDEHQVIVITHSPQVASKADCHYFIYKEVKGERTRTNVRLLDTDQRVHAIATMLSQDPPSDSAIENAKELMEVF